jgi:hypothetical protein
MTNYFLKRVLLLLLLFSFNPIAKLAAIAAPVPNDAEAKKEAQAALAHMSKWSAPDKDISLSYPSNWESEGAKGAYQVLAFKTFKGLVNGHLMEVNVGANASLDKIAILPKEVSVLGQKCPTTLVSRSQIQVNKQPAVCIVYKYMMPVAVPYERRISQITMLNKGREYLLNFGAPASIYDDFDGCRKQIVDSIQLN